MKLKNRKRGVKMALIGAVTAVTLALMPALSASAVTYLDWGTYSSSDGGAKADGSYTQHAIVSSQNGIGVHGVLYDVKSDGKGATLRTYANFYNSSSYFVGQDSAEGRELDGYGTHKNVDLGLTWPSGSVKATLYVFVCNGKGDNNVNLNCGTQHAFNLKRG